MLEKLFKSKTTVRLISLLLSGKSYHLREIARRIGITPSYVKKELETLKQLGIVSESRIGNLRLWGMNHGSPIYEDLKRMFIKTECLGDRLRGTLRRYDIEYALIFGSFASGKENEKSDIDLLVVGDVDEDELFAAISKSEEEIGREMNYILWRGKDLRKRIRERLPLLDEIAHNPVIWIAGDENEFRKIIGGRIHPTSG